MALEYKISRSKANRVLSRECTGHRKHLEDDTSNTVIDASAAITNLDTGATYNGLKIDAGAIDFRCNMFAINNWIGCSGLMTFVSSASGHFVTDIELDEDGHVTNVEYGDVSYNTASVPFHDGLMIAGDL